MSIMKAIVLDAPGPPEALQIRDVPIPSPTRGEVLIKVAALGVNRSELHTRLGLAEGVTSSRPRHRGDRHGFGLSWRGVPGGSASGHHDGRNGPHV